ncbi:hypothetical protein COLO4_20252 [Corchorus olitorius]|uniref:Uncharacterized protein n=1 Tax=Corchorus olitorius TaxID=93759 RepID=A0A1R3J0T8_9ROSI|nr:hypothetical protein COLO4_20252 [Corchorus olitorius]
MYASVGWSNLFPRALGWYEANLASNHCPVFLCLEKIKKNRKFKSKWLLDQECAEVMEDGEIESRLKRIKEIQMLPLTKELKEELTMFKKEVDEKWQMEERFWHQRIKNNNGAWLTEEEDIRRFIFESYKELFKAGELEDVEEVLGSIEAVVTPEMNEALGRQISREEIEEAIFFLWVPLKHRGLMVSLESSITAFEIKSKRKCLKLTWVPNLPQFRVTSTHSQAEGPMIVKDLINFERRCWKESVFRAFFNQTDIKAIKKIPIGSEKIDDRIKWHFTRDGNYSVKSGYRLLQSEANSNDDNRQSSSGMQQAVWRASFFSYSSRREGFAGFLKWWEEAITNFANAGSSNAIGLICYLCWNIWKARNACLFEGREGDTIEVWNQAFAEFMEFKEGAKTTNRLQEPRLTQQVWQPPQRDFIKFNCDAAVDIPSGDTGITIVCRNHNGDLINGASFFTHTDSVDVAEALAVRLATRLACNRG